LLDYLLHSTGWIVASLLCLGGIFASLLSFTGAWLIVLAALALFLIQPETPMDWTLIAVFVVICIALEIVEFFSAKLGVSKRGGSAAAGWAALAGGIAGMFLGTFIPVPVFGTLIGMILGSFLAAFYVEKRRLNHDEKAAHIAWGAVWARLIVMLVKTGAALSMTAYLVFAAVAD